MEIVTGADPLDRISDLNCGSRTFRGGPFCLPELGVIKVAVLISFGHLFILIASDFLVVQVASDSLGNSPNDPLMIALKPQLTLHNFERCVVRLINMIRVGTRLSLLDFHFTSCLLRHIGHQLLLRSQRIVTVRVRVRFWRTVGQIGKQVSFVIVRTKPTLLLLQRVNLQDSGIM